MSSTLPLRLTVLCMLVFAGAARAQHVDVVTFEQLQTMIAHPSDTTFVYNFFATWCDPCREEFPALQKWAQVHHADKTALVYISLDFKKSLKRALLPFLKKQNVKERVLLLDETDYNAWINRVDSTWDGSLPMTLVVNTVRGMRRGFPRAFTFQEFQETISPLLP